MGQDFGEQALRMDQMEISRQIVDGKLAYGTFYKDHLAGKDKDLNYPQWSKNFEQAHDQWSAEYLKNVTTPAAKMELEKWLSGEKNQHSIVLHAEGSRLYAAETRSRIPSLVQQYVEDAAPASPKSVQMIREDLRKSLSHFVEEGVLFSGAVDDALNDFDKGLEPVREAKALVNAQKAVMAVPDRKAAEGLIDSLTGVLKRADREDLLAQVNRKFDIADLAAKQQQQADENKIYEAIYTPKNVEALAGVEDMIRQTASFDADTKEKWRNRLQDHIKQLSGTGPDSPFEKTMNPAKKQELLEKATRDEIRLDEVEKWVGKKDGISISDGQEIRRVLEDDAHIFKTSQVKAWFSKLNSDFGGPKNDPVRAADYAEKMRQYFLDYEKANKKLPSSKEVEEFYDKNFVGPGILEKLKSFIASRISGFRSPAATALQTDIRQRIRDWAEGKEQQPALWDRPAGKEQAMESGRRKTEDRGRKTEFQLEDPGRPASYEDFKANVAAISDDAKARAYYERWKNLWQ